MPKAGEINYLQMAGEHGIAFATNKPFSHPECGQHFVALGAIRMLLPPPPARLLDLGCGTGWTSCMFAQMGYDVVGQDIAPDMIHCANVNKQRYQVSNVRFIVSDYESVDFDGQFDCAVFFDSLHHAENERLALETVYRALRKGGMCITHEPGKGHAEAEQSREAVEKYGVTEKDMPPCYIISIAKEIGFIKQSCQPFPERIVEYFIEPANDGRDVKSLPWHKRLGRAWRRERNRRRFFNSRHRRAMRDEGLVILVK